MRYSLFATLAAAAVKSVMAEDLLFVDSFEFVEYQEATTKLGYTSMCI